jgi:hypothetical protein
VRFSSHTTESARRIAAQLAVLICLGVLLGGCTSPPGPRVPARRLPTVAPSPFVPIAAKESALGTAQRLYVAWRENKPRGAVSLASDSAIATLFGWRWDSRFDPPSTCRPLMSQTVQCEPERFQGADFVLFWVTKGANHGYVVSAAVFEHCPNASPNAGWGAEACQILSEP